MLRTVGKVADIQQSVRIMAHMDLAPFVTYLILHMIRLTNVVFVNSINLITNIVPLHFFYSYIQICRHQQMMLIKQAILKMLKYECVLH